MELEAYRGELVAYCYRMLGSFHEAEDLVQETMLRAWKARDRYDPGRASERTWLYRIATNACLTALTGRAGRPLPSGLAAPSQDPAAPLTPAFDIPWLQPFPDARFDIAARADLRLALVAAMQLLPPRQRAVLVLREVLEFSAAEVAGQLGSTVAAVNSALQRARAAVADARDEGEIAEPDDPGVRNVIEQYVAAFEAADVAGLVRLLTDDAVLEMPPVPLWYRGSQDYGLFMHRVFEMRGKGWRAHPLSANGGQPATRPPATVKTCSVCRTSARADEPCRCRRYVPVSTDPREAHREHHRYRVHHHGRDRVRPGRIAGDARRRLGVPARPAGSRRRQIQDGRTLDDGVMLLGRKTWQLFSHIWPGREDPFSAKMNAAAKLVASSTLTDTSAWANSQVIPGDVTETVRHEPRDSGTGGIDRQLCSSATDENSGR